MKNVKIGIIFMGTSEFANKIFKSLLKENYNIISVYTRPGKKVGRKHEIQEPVVKLTAQEKNIPVFQPEKLDEKAVEEIKKQKPDLIIVAAYGKIIPQSILKLPDFGVINVHPSLLPKYRGPSPIQNALLNGDIETGTTIILMNTGVDTGDILQQIKIEISKNETREELTEKLAELSAKLLLEVVPLWIEKKIKPKKQNNSEATLCQLIEKDDGRIIWADEAESIYNRYRALSPWPGIFAYWKIDNSAKRLKFNKISFMKNNPEIEHNLGEVFQIGDKIGVQTTKGIIFLEEVQMEGKDNMRIEDFLNGYRNFIGSILN